MNGTRIGEMKVFLMERLGWVMWESRWRVCYLFVI